MDLSSSLIFYFRLILLVVIISEGFAQPDVSGSKAIDSITSEQEGTTVNKSIGSSSVSSDDQLSKDLPKILPASEHQETSTVKTPRVKDSFGEDNLLLEGYDKEVPPRLNEPYTLPNGTIIHIDSRVIVRTLVFIRSVRNIEDSDEVVTLDMDLHLMWMDGNIRNELRSNGRKLMLHLKEHEPKLKVLKKSVHDRLWIPDVYFMEGDKVNRPKVLDDKGLDLMYSPDYGAPCLRLRMRISLECEMDFAYYPADTQKSSNSNDDVHLTWWNKRIHGVYLAETSDPNFSFQVTGVDEYEEPHDVGPESSKSRLYSVLKFELWIKRKMSYHIIQTYLPSMFFIVVTWLAYLIPPRMVEARIGVTMTTLLTMTSMFSSLRENTPIVGYVKAIDIRIVISVFFIFWTLIALTVSACIRSIKGALKKKQEDASQNNKQLEKMHHKMKFVIALEIFLEKYTVFLLCGFFIIFIELYWTWLLNSSSDFVNWTPNETYHRMQPEKAK